MPEKLVVLPPEYIFTEEPIIFLAGPIQGAEDWQKTAIEIVHGVAPHIVIASPRKKYLAKEFVYEKQVDWETHYLRRAGENGVIVFWLARETEHTHERAYAQTSRFELGEWKERHIRDDVKLVVGIEEGFSGARYIRRRLSQDCPDVPIFDSLEEACKKAVELVS